MNYIGNINREVRELIVIWMHMQIKYAKYYTKNSKHFDMLNKMIKICTVLNIP